MLRLELVNRKRKPIKKYGIAALVAGVIFLVLIGIAGDSFPDVLKYILIGLSGCSLVFGFFVLNYSFGFRNTIGHITFKTDRIIIEIFSKEEVIMLDGSVGIVFRFSGYQGLDNTTLFDVFIGLYNRFSFHSGMNNFVYIWIYEERRIFEFYVANKRQWIELHKLAKHYKSSGY
ncbi:MAG: hypothetical protein U0X39_11755 [Bacteroidales bacterium]